MKLIAKTASFVLMLLMLVGCSTSKEVVTNKRFQKRKLQSGFYLNFGNDKAKNDEVENALEITKHIDLEHEEITCILDSKKLIDTISIKENEFAEIREKVSYIKTSKKENKEINKVLSTTKSVVKLSKNFKKRVVKKMEPKKTQDELVSAALFFILSLLFMLGWGCL